MWYTGGVVSAWLQSHMTTRDYSLKGPPSAGNPEMEICTLAPVPFEFELTATAPRTVVSVLLGSMAMYCVPMGLLSTTGASVEDPSVEGTSLGASLLGVVGALGESLLGALTPEGSVLVESTVAASLAGVSGAVSGVCVSALGVSELSTAGASGAAGGSSAGGASGVAGGSSAGGESAASGAAGASSAGALSCAKARSAKSARNKMRKRMVVFGCRVVQ